MSGISGLYGDGPYTVFVPVEENNNISIVSAAAAAFSCDINVSSLTLNVCHPTLAVSL